MNMNILRTVLIISVGVLIVLAVVGYFYRGDVSYTTIYVAGGCLLIYLITGAAKTKQ